MAKTKLALNAVKLPKFEAVNEKSWPPRTMVVKIIYGNVQRNFVHAQRAM